MSGEKAQYNLPKVIKRCTRCILTNTRPIATNEYKNKMPRTFSYVKFDEEGVCSACRFCEKKDKEINWKEREEELLNLLDKYRSKDGSYDCIVPGSGGKDSVYASHILKYKYGMHPLTVTWSPHLYTDIGWKNFQNWIHIGGFDNYLFTPNGKIHSLLTRNAFLNLLHPFQPFIMGQKTFAVKMAARFNIPLLFYGENPGEYGTNVDASQSGFVMNESEDDDDGPRQEKKNAGFTLKFIDSNDNFDEIYLGGKSITEYLEEGVLLGDLEPYFPIDPQVIQEKKIDFRYLGYYLKWVPQECYYYAAEHAGFEANPVRTEGTYSKYNSLDDKIDGFFYYTMFIKFGYGRTTREGAQEVRNHHITREEGIALLKRFEGEFPQRYFKDFLRYIDISEDEFWETIDAFRHLELWEKDGNEWKLKQNLFE